jgi:hypothetical protein
MMERMLDREFSEGDVQKIVNLVCRKLEIPDMGIFPMSIEQAMRQRALAYYAYYHKGFKHVAVMLCEDDLQVALHELAHHIQDFLYDDSSENGAHGSTFSLACNRIKTVLKKSFGEKAFPYESSILRRTNNERTKSNKIFQDAKNSLH